MAKPNPKVGQITDKNFFETGELLIVNIRKFGGTSQMADEQAEERFKEDQDVLKGIQDLLLPEDRDLIKKYESIKSMAHSYVAGKSLPHPLPCFYYIRTWEKENVETELKEYQIMAREVAQSVVDSFADAEKKYAKEKPNLYRPEKYPSKADLLSRFVFNWRWVKEVSYSGDDGLKEDVRWMKRYALIAIKKTIVERMTALSNDKVSQATLDSIQSNIFDKYDRLFSGFVDNVDVKQAISDLKDYLEGTDAEMLRSDDNFKALVTDKAKSIAKTIKKVKVDKGDRQLLF